MARIYDCSVDSELLTGMRLARAAIARGECVVLPTDTVYGIAADAFNPDAVQRLLDAKGRTRASPPPVLIPGIPTLDALAETVHPLVRTLVERFWPGALTIIVRAQPSLSWDLGDTRGTVALRMPDNPLMLELLSEVGPLAVSSANRTGEPSATSAIEAADGLGDAVALYLDGGNSPESRLASTIIDATGLVETTGRPADDAAAATDATPEAASDSDSDSDADSNSDADSDTAAATGTIGTVKIVRQGAITREDIREVLGDALEAGG